MSDNKTAKIEINLNELKIPSKEENQKALIIDALRILSWKNYKSDNKIKGLEAYESFGEAWTKHSIHSFSLEKLLAYLKQSGWSEQELLKMRESYYQQNSKFNDNKPVAMTDFF